jgi:hypothetical protein
MSKIKERRVWFFTCDKCGSERRQSHRKYKAKEAICRSCRKKIINPNQPRLFEAQEINDENSID